MMRPTGEVAGIGFHVHPAKVADDEVDPAYLRRIYIS
jgi:hypothetical protein